MRYAQQAVASMCHAEKEEQAWHKQYGRAQ